MRLWCEIERIERCGSDVRWDCEVRLWGEIIEILFVSVAVVRLAGCVLFWSISWRDFFLASLNQFWGITNKLNTIPAAQTSRLGINKRELQPVQIVCRGVLSCLRCQYVKIYTNAQQTQPGAELRSAYTIRYQGRFMQKKSWDNAKYYKPGHWCFGAESDNAEHRQGKYTGRQNM